MIGARTAKVGDIVVLYVVESSLPADAIDAMPHESIDE